MKKIMLILVSIIAFAETLSAQQGMGIGSQLNHSSAIVDISKSNKGLLIPRLTQNARLFINNPAEGLMVFDTTSNRFYNYQNGLWAYLINNTYWAQSSVGRYIYSLDSIGIGNTSPGKRLDVTGTIRARSSLRTDNLAAGGILQGNDIAIAGNMVVTGYALINGNITAQGSVTADDASPLVQLAIDGADKAFMQISGDDLRLGTNSGNDYGRIIIRMNGNDIITIDGNSNFKVLAGGSGGNISLGQKLARNIAADDNMLSISSGRVNADGSLRWSSDNTPPDITRVSPGVYEIKTWGARLTGRSIFLLTPGGTAPRICSATFIGPPNGSYLLVEIYDPINRVFVDTEFSYIIHDPANIFD
jgi:cytoskeletal protein CcmA (bactofilin family)